MLPIPVLQWSKLNFCNFINICGIKLEMREKQGFYNLVGFGPHVENTKKVTEF